MHLRLDLQYFAGEKTEKATPKKREDEREKGRVAKSQDVNTALLLLFCFISLALLGTFMKDSMLGVYAHAFTEFIHWDINIHSTMEIFRAFVLEFAKIVGPIMLVAVIVSVVANLLQVGFLFTTEPLKFDLKKIDPISGAKRIFS